MSKKNLEIVDDDTLFLLMALKHQGNIVIKGYDSVYAFGTNYDETVVNPDGDILTSEELANNAIEWMSAKFGIVSVIKQDKTYGVIIELTIEDKTVLEAFLSEYLSEFIQSEYYESEEKHKKVLYEYLKDEDSVVIEFPKKVFTYRFLAGNENALKYKMIEYLMYLLEQNILTIEGIDKPFRFNNDGKEGLKKVIKLEFTGNKAKEFFEGKKNVKTKKEPIPEGNVIGSFEIFTLYQNGLFCSRNNKFQRTEPLEQKVLEHCFKKRIKTFTYDELAEVLTVSFEEVPTRISNVNAVVKTLLSNRKAKLFKNKAKTKEYDLKFTE